MTQFNFLVIKYLQICDFLIIFLNTDGRINDDDNIVGHNRVLFFILVNVIAVVPFGKRQNGMAVELQRYIFDPMLVKPKCV